MKNFSIVLIALSFVVSGCASNPDSLRMASAGNIKGDYIPSEIEVSEINRGTYTVDWTALTADGKKYKCSADDMVRRVSCKQR